MKKKVVYYNMDRAEDWSKKGRKHMWVISQGFLKDGGIKKEEKIGVVS